ncbi:hypothetical protein HQ845_14135, partial [Enterococcus faecium]|nr:hypothetical protein [Enterococcus faecium]
ILREADKVYSNYNGKVSWVIYSFLIKEFFKEQINNSYELGYHFTVYYEDIIKRLEDLEWYAYYDLLEVFASAKILDKKKREEVNKILESENSGYRLSESNEFIQITDDISNQSINAVSESPFNYAKNHIHKSLTYISEKENQDYNTVVREAISAVESCLIEFSGLPANKKILWELL